VIRLNYRPSKSLAIDHASVRPKLVGGIVLAGVVIAGLRKLAELFDSP
jgi:hypothetical protein